MISSKSELLDRARSLATPEKRVILAVVGAPGAGKSTVTDMLVEELRRTPPTGASEDWVAHLPMDGYHLSDHQLDRLGRRERKGAVDTFDVAGYVAMLRRLNERDDETVYAPGFERELEQPIAATIAIPRDARLILTEGLYLLHDGDGWSAAADFFVESWFCVLDPEIRKQRLVDRHVRFGKSVENALSWVSNVDEPNAVMVERSRRRASQLIDVAAL